MGKNNARMTDPNLLIQGGIDPITKLPIKYNSANPCFLKDALKRRLRIMDEQDAVNCFTWYNLPSGITPQLLERILYYKGQGVFFYVEELNEFFFLPYTLHAPNKGTGIDIYGRYKEVTPIVFNGAAEGEQKNSKIPFIPNLYRECIYEVELQENYINEDGSIDVDGILNTQNNKCVLLHDYTEQISQTVQSNQMLNDPILDVMAEMVPYARTALINGTGVQGMRVIDEDSGTQVELASKAVNNAALNGKKWVPIVGNTEFQDLTSGNLAKAEEYFLALQSIDNLRLSFYGLDNGGLFQKKSHMLEAEQEMNAGNVGLIMRDRLQNRQNFCTLVNSVWGLNIWCETSEAALGMDKNGDKVAGDNEDQGTNMGGTAQNKEDNSNEL